MCFLGICYVSFCMAGFSFFINYSEPIQNNIFTGTVYFWKSFYSMSFEWGIFWTFMMFSCVILTYAGMKSLKIIFLTTHTLIFPFFILYMTHNHSTYATVFVFEVFILLSIIILTFHNIKIVAKVKQSKIEK